MVSSAERIAFLIGFVVLVLINVINANNDINDGVGGLFYIYLPVLLLSRTYHRINEPRFKCGEKS